MNRLQGIDESMPLFVSLNPVIEPRQELTFGEWSFAHPQFDARALSAQARLDDIQRRARHLVRRRMDRAWLSRGRAALRPRRGDRARRDGAVARTGAGELRRPCWRWPRSDGG